MKKVKMLKDVRGKVNGVPMGPYPLGSVQELDDERADLFLGSAMAELVVDPVPDAAEEAAAPAETAEPQPEPRGRRGK
jgi:hypothetical protein